MHSWCPSGGMAPCSAIHGIGRLQGKSDGLLICKFLTIIRAKRPSRPMHSVPLAVVMRREPHPIWETLRGWHPLPTFAMAISVQPAVWCSAINAPSSLQWKPLAHWKEWLAHEPWVRSPYKCLILRLHLWQGKSDGMPTPGPPLPGAPPLQPTATVGT